MCHHVMREGGINCPPVTCHIQENKKPKQNREKYFQGTPLSLVEIEDLMQGVSPKFNYTFHWIHCIERCIHGHNPDLLDRK